MIEDKKVSFIFGGQLFDAMIAKEHVRDSFIRFIDLADNQPKIITKNDCARETYIQLYNELQQQTNS